MNRFSQNIKKAVARIKNSLRNACDDVKEASREMATDQEQDRAERDAIAHRLQKKSWVRTAGHADVQEDGMKIYRTNTRRKLSDTPDGFEADKTALFTAVDN